MNDETIWVEKIDDNKNNSEPVINIFLDSTNGLGFTSTVDAMETLKILTYLSNYILENHVG